MHRLERRDELQVYAAAGWLQLGNAIEAKAELSKLSAAAREVPDVLEVIWQVHVALKEWAEALKAAEVLQRLAPERSSSWIERAFALRRVPGGGLEQAKEVLLEGLRFFPEEPLLYYNLACYAAQCGKPEEAMDWLKQAVKIAEDPAMIRKLAAHDEDLTSLRHRLSEL